MVLSPKAAGHINVKNRLIMDIGSLPIRAIRFSIVIPTLNCIDSIGSCLNSIKDQTYSGLEIIVVDGGSSDGTWEYLSSSQNTTLRISRVTGSSIYEAMNVGVQKATGDYCLFLGADDTLYAPSTLFEVAQQPVQDYDLIIGNAYIGEKPFYSRIDPDLSYRHTLHHQGVFYRREIFNQIGYYDNNFQLLADWALNRQIIRSGVRLFFLNQFISRCGEEGTSRKRIWRLRYERFLLISDWPLYLRYRLKKLFRIS
jgi:putative colanic acid biosynthesis glycosyltransferase